MKTQFRSISLKEFLDQLDGLSCDLPPTVHTTAAWRIYDIMQAGPALRKSEFKDGSCYVFVGRPAFKWGGAQRPDYWTSPLAFVFRDCPSAVVSKIHPFDTGAFSCQMYPDYIAGFGMQRFDLGLDLEIVGKLIAAFFENSARYIQGNALSEEKFSERFSLTPRHQEIRALSKLYNEAGIVSVDDRAKSIEIQLDGDVPLHNALGVVVPDPYLSDAELVEALASSGCRIEGYPVYPNKIDSYFPVVYDRVQKIIREYLSC